MYVKGIFFKELIRRGYTYRGRTKVWDISSSKLWYLTPELAKGYLNLKNYPPFRQRVIDDEIELIRKNAQSILKKFNSKKFNLIDLGCGDGAKAAAFIRQAPKNVNLRYCPVDISPYLLKMAAGKIKSLKFQQVENIKPTLVDFTKKDHTFSMLRSTEYQKNLVLLLGETISHYEIHELIFKLSRDLLPGEVILIGNGIRTGKRFEHLEKYRSSLFNEWFINIMRAIGFSDSEVGVNVRFTNERLEGFYHILVDKTIQYGNKRINFHKGDEIVVGAQNKFFEKELKKCCKMYFSEVKLYKNPQREYCLVVCRR